MTCPCNSAFVGILSCSAASGHCTTPHPSLKPSRGFVDQGSWGLSLEGWGLAALWFLGCRECQCWPPVTMQTKAVSH